MSDTPDQPEPRPPHAGSPRRGRLHALKVLFQADLRGETPGAALARVAGDPHALALLDDLDDTAPAGEEPAEVDAFTRRPVEVDAFTRRLVEGVDEHRDEIDARIQRFARRWAISRMPVVDRNVLRLATFELLHEDTPAAIVIDEALELAKALSTDNSSRYVNGVLDSVRKSIATERGGAA